MFKWLFETKRPWDNCRAELIAGWTLTVGYLVFNGYLLYLGVCYD